MLPARTRELAALNAIAEVASRSLNLDEILNDALDKILEVLEMDVGSAYTLDDEGRNLKLLEERGLFGEFIDRVNPRPLKGSVIEQSCI